MSAVSERTVALMVVLFVTLGAAADKIEEAMG